MWNFTKDLMITINKFYTGRTKNRRTPDGFKSSALWSFFSTKKSLWNYHVNVLSFMCDILDELAWNLVRVSLDAYFMPSLI